MAQKSRRWLKRMGIALLVLLAVVAGAFAWYVSDYSHADDTARTALSQSVQGDISLVELEDGSLAFVPSSPTVGMVFYPGAKVEAEAYAPLLHTCAEQGILCVLVHPPFNFALLNVGAAQQPMAAFPEIERWIMCGHSLGGVAASSFTNEHAGEVDALVLLASYPACDLSNYQGDVLTIVGENDQVVNHDKLEAARNDLPSGARTLIVKGGNHAYFGNYGEQAGDGTATISHEAQQEQTAKAISELMGKE